LPVMVDADDGYGDAKNVTRVVRRRALDDMKHERLHLDGEGVSFDDFEKLLDLREWAKIEENYRARQ
ncbi:MAG: hypothetical protein JO165_11590, partial [Candidatus Eremiobacteraeota bacterium]|nr:hypothetical protein [Candidatus Eremiobacteraeota bacterium]